MKLLFFVCFLFLFFLPPSVKTILETISHNLEEHVLFIRTDDNTIFDRYSVENSYLCLFELSKKKEKRTSSRHSLLVTSLNCQYEQLMRRRISLFLLYIYLIDVYICVKKQTVVFSFKVKIQSIFNCL